VLRHAGGTALPATSIHRQKSRALIRVARFHGTPAAQMKRRPAEKIMPVGAQCRLRPARGLQVAEELRDGRHGPRRRRHDPVWLPWVSVACSAPASGTGQRRQVPDHILLFGHEAGTIATLFSIRL